MKRGLKALASGSASLVVLAIGCRQIAGIEDGPPTEATSAVCGLPYGTADCAVCAENACCAESTACAADPSCSAYQSCLADCAGEPNCRAQCTIDHPVTSSSVSALSACLASKCEGACGPACGGFGAYVSPPETAADCQTCLNANVCAEGRSCASSQDCDAYARCFRSCTELDCRSYCAIENDAGASAFAPLLAANRGTCPAACGVGHDWSCIGNLRSPIHPAEATTARGIVTDMLDYTKPIAGAALAYCNFCPCVGVDAVAGSVVLGQTTADGSGAFTLEGRNPVDNAYRGDMGCWQITASGRVPNLIYWGFRASAPSVDTDPGTAVLGTPDEIAVIYEAGHATQDTSRGLVFCYVVDCLGAQSPGAHVTLDDDADGKVTAFYSQRIDTTLSATTADALSGFLNVAPGPHILKATNASGVMTSAVSVNVVARGVTSVLLTPNQ